MSGEWGIVTDVQKQPNDKWFFSDFKYETRFKKLGLTTLETRRLRDDLIEVFKILKGYDDIGEDIFFVRSKSSLRGHQLKLQKRVLGSTLRNILLVIE